MKGKRKDDHFVKKAYYEGGISKMRKFISANLKYPESALENKIEGDVFVNYSIDHKGNVVKTQVIQGISNDCDKEAERLVKLFKFIVPKNNRKLKVLFHKKIRIHFRLPKKTSVPQQISYTIKTKEYKPVSAKPKESSGYSYTITL